MNDITLDHGTYRYYAEHAHSGAHIKVCSSGSGWKIHKKFKSVEELDKAWDELQEELFSSKNVPFCDWLDDEGQLFVVRPRGDMFRIFIQVEGTGELIDPENNLFAAMGSRIHSKTQMMLNSYAESKGWAEAPGNEAFNAMITRTPVEAKYTPGSAISIGSDTYYYYPNNSIHGMCITASIEGTGTTGVWNKYKDIAALDKDWEYLLAKAAYGEKETVDAELLPPENSSIEETDPLKEQAVSYHNAARHHAGLAVVYAAMCGFAIRRKKADLGHRNGFSEWKKGLPFSEKTAENYMSLSQEFEARMPDLAGFDVLSLPATTAAAASEDDFPADATFREFAEKVSDLAGGSTLTQLYFDWGIMRPPRELGGNPLLQKWLTENHPRVQARTPDDLSAKLRREFDAWLEAENEKARQEMGPNGENIYHGMAVRVWNVANDKMYEFFRGRELYAYMDRHELLAIADLLTDYAKDIRNTLNAKG